MGIKFKYGYGLYDSKAYVCTNNRFLEFIYRLYLRLRGFRKVQCEEER